MRPLNLGETLDAAIKIVRARWRTLAMVMVVIALPLQLLDLLIVTQTTDTYHVGSGFTTDSAASRTTYSNRDAFVGGQVLVQLLSLLSYLLGTVACYRVIADTYLGREATAAESLRFAGRRAGATVWLSILLGLGLVGGLILLVIPGVWLAIAWVVAFPVMLVEGTGGTKALRRSMALVKGRWWATLGRLLVANILASVVSFAALIVPLAIVGAVLDDTSFGALLLEHAANFAVSLLTTPFIAAVTMLVYFDLRVRKEGFDLALLAERMGGAPAAGPAPPEDGGGHDAFGRPAAPEPRPAPAPSGSLWSPPSPGGGWAPPVAPEPRRPPAPGA
jgi:hypothetical protein